MLRIDRVKTEMDVLPAGSAPAPGVPPATAESFAILSDPQARERIKEMVLEALREHLRELERRGVV
jgi:hypothetical protein